MPEDSEGITLCVLEKMGSLRKERGIDPEKVEGELIHSNLTNREIQTPLG